MSNCEPKMAHSLRSVLLIATVATATILVGPCGAQDVSGSDSDAASSGSSGPPSANPDSSVLPVPTATPGESGRVDLNNQAVTSGVASFITPVARPARWTAFVVLDFVLRNFVGQKLPCTVWSVVPPRVACTMLVGPSMTTK